MASKTHCYASFASAIKALGGIVSDQARVDKFLDGFKGNRDWAKNMLDKRVKELNKELDKIIVEQKQTITTDEALVRAKDAVKRKMVDIHSTLTRTNDIIIKADNRLKGLSDQKEVENGIKSILQDTYDGLDAADRRFDEMLLNVIDNLETSGKQSNPVTLERARKLFFEHMAGGDALKDYLAEMGIKDWKKALFNARKQDTSKEDVLNVIGTILVQADSVNVPNVKATVPYFNADADYKMPMYANFRKLGSVGKDTFIKDGFLKEALDWDKLIKKNASEDDISKWLGEYYDEFSQPPSTVAHGYVDNTGIYGRKRLVFKKSAGWEAEYEFLTRYGADDFDPIIDSVAHMRKLNSDAVLYNRHGADIDFNLTVLADHIGRNKAVTDPDNINRVIDSHSYFMQRKPELSKTGSAILNVSNIARSLSSATLVVKGVVRDLAFDQTLYSAIQKRLLTGEGSVLVDWLTNISQISRRSIMKGKDFDNFVNQMEAAGLALKMSYSQLFQGLRRDFNYNTKGDTATGGIARGTNKFAEGISKLNLTDRVHSASKAFHVSAAIKHITDVIDGKKAGKGLTQLLDGMGLGEAELAVLKKIKRNTIKDPYRNKDLDLMDFTEILRLKDEDIVGIARPLETAADTRNRLYMDVVQLVQTTSDQLSARPSLKGQRIRPGKDAVASSVVSNLLQFDNIASTQWYNMMQMMLAGVGLNPNKVGGHLQLNTLKAFKHNPVMMSKLLTYGITAGVMQQWIWDMMTGHEPREFSPEMIGDAIQFTGMGGFANTAYTQFKYNDGALGVPALSTVEPVKRLGSALMSKPSRQKQSRVENAVLNLTDRTPGLNIFWMRAGKDYLLQEQLGLRETNRKRKKRLEQGKKRWWE